MASSNNPTAGFKSPIVSVWADSDQGFSALTHSEISLEIAQRTLESSAHSHSSPIWRLFSVGEWRSSLRDGMHGHVSKILRSLLRQSENRREHGNFNGASLDRAREEGISFWLVSKDTAMSVHGPLQTRATRISQEHLDFWRSQCVCRFLRCDPKIVTIFGSQHKKTRRKKRA